MSGLFKSLKFGILAAAGCLAAALFGEAILARTLPPPETAPRAQPVDVMFVLDVTGSMRGEIAGIQRSIERFVEEFRQRDLDARVGLIAFRDRFEGEEPEVLRFDGQPFTRDTERFRREVGRLVAEGGGDDAESALDALMLAARMPYRPEAVKVVLLISDAPPKVPDRQTFNVEEALVRLKRNGIDQLHLVVQKQDLAAYSRLLAGMEGDFFPLAESAAARLDFHRVLPEVGGEIAEAIRTGSVVQARRETPAERFGALVVATGGWTGALALGIFLSLVMGQNRYLRRPLLTAGQGLGGGAGSFLTGLGAGAAGQALYGMSAFIPMVAEATRVVSWAALGGLLGWGTSRFIPNLKGRHALAGGTVGGALGALGFLAVAAVAGEAPARFLGAATLGFFIGMMVVLAEAVFRKAWLEVVYEPGQVRTVNLGSDPVTVGSDRKLALVALYGIRPLEGTYRFQDGKIFYQDQESRRVEEVPPGSERIFGGVVVRARASR